ncbi:MAG: hypothetical protein WCH43_12760 [Verrucomicrobiota bacterium]
MQVNDFKGEPIHDGTYLLLFNAHHESMDFILPEGGKSGWELLLSTDSGFLEKPEIWGAGDKIQLIDRSLCLFQTRSSFTRHDLNRS